MSKSERDIVKEIIGAMLKEDIVPSLIDIEVSNVNEWTITGEAIAETWTVAGLRHKFEGSAFSDGSFKIKSGAFGELTEKGLDVFADLSPTELIDPDYDDDQRGWPEEAKQ